MGAGPARDAHIKTTRLGSDRRPTCTTAATPRSQQANAVLAGDARLQPPRRHHASAGATSSGYYTRFGDVRELLKGIDDRYVIMNAGDEMSLRFAEQPPPPAGWVRDFVIAATAGSRMATTTPPAPGPCCLCPTTRRREYNHGARQTRRRVGVPPASRRLAELPYPLRHRPSPSTTRSAQRGSPMNAQAAPREYILAIVFVALLAVPLAIKRSLGATAEQVQARLDGEPALTRYGFHLQEVSHAAGIDFVHQAPGTRPQARAHHAPGRLDGRRGFRRRFRPRRLARLLRHQQRDRQQQRLYRNQHDGTFKDVAAELGMADVNQAGTGVSMGAVWGDYDNDGYEDLLVYKWGRPELFHNDRGKGFTRVTEQAGLPHWINANTAIWFDYDRDGLLDLFIGGYWAEDIDLWHLKTTRIMPESFEYAKNGGRKYLLPQPRQRQVRGGQRRNRDQQPRWALAAAAADLRGTGYPDLFLANDYGVSELYLNDGKRFHEVGKADRRRLRTQERHERRFGDVFNQGTSPSTCPTSPKKAC